MKGNRSKAVRVAGESRHLALWKLRTADCIELASSSSAASCFAYCPLLALPSGIINNNLFFIFPVAHVCVLRTSVKSVQAWGSVRLVLNVFLLTVNQMNLLKWLAPRLYLFTPKSSVTLHRLGCCFVLPESLLSKRCIPTVGVLPLAELIWILFSRCFIPSYCGPTLGSVLGGTEKCMSVSALKKHSCS